MKYYRTFNTLACVFVIAFPVFLWTIMKTESNVKPTLSPAPAVAAPPLNYQKKSSALSADRLLEVVADLESESHRSVTNGADSGYGSSDEMSMEEYMSTDSINTDSIGETSSASAATSEPIVVSSSASSGSTSMIASSSSGSSSSISGSSGGSGGTATNPSTSPTSSNGGSTAPSSLPSELSKPHNIGAVFLHQQELASRGRRLPLATAMENLLKYDAFWNAQTIAERYPEAWRTLRTEHSDRLALYYVTLFTTRPNAPASYLDFDYIEQYHPEWFLLKDEKNATLQDYRDWNKRIRWNPDDPKDWRYNRFFLDVGNTEFQEWAANEFLKKLSPVSGVNARIRYSGIGGDNGLFYAWSIGKTKSYPNWKYPDDNGSRWTRKFISYLKTLHNSLNAQDYILVVNATIGYYDDRYRQDWEQLVGSVDGLLDEWGVRYSTGLYGSSHWESILRYHEENLNRGLYDWWLFDAFDDYRKVPFTKYEHFLYEYCSFLLIMNKDLSLYGILETSEEWFEEFNLPLGDPVGKCYQYQNCWLRDYQYGRVVVNPSKTTASLELDGDRYTLDWRTKKQITRLTLKPLSATILLPTAYPLN